MNKEFTVIIKLERFGVDELAIRAFKESVCLVEDDDDYISVSIPTGRDAYEYNIFCNSFALACYKIRRNLSNSFKDYEDEEAFVIEAAKNVPKIDEELDRIFKDYTRYANVVHIDNNDVILDEFKNKIINKPVSTNYIMSQAYAKGRI